MNDRELRSVLGKFATGVCVITTSGESVSALGVTVNSFCSLSLSPPLVMWSLGIDSDCFDSFAQVDRYAVNILTEDQQDLSQRFSQKFKHSLGDGEWKEGQTGCPVLTDSLAVLECKIESRVEGGDHVILIGRVLSASIESDANPLIFFGGQYTSLCQEKLDYRS